MYRSANVQMCVEDRYVRSLLVNLVQRDLSTAAFVAFCEANFQGEADMPTGIHGSPKCRVKRGLNKT